MNQHRRQSSELSDMNVYDMHRGPSSPEFSSMQEGYYTGSQPMRYTISRRSDASGSQSTRSSQYSFAHGSAGSPTTPTTLLLSPTLSRPQPPYGLIGDLPPVYDSFTSPSDMYPVDRYVEAEALFSPMDCGLDTEPWSPQSSVGCYSTSLVSPGDLQVLPRYPLHLPGGTEHDDYNISPIDSPEAQSVQYLSSGTNLSGKDSKYKEYLQAVVENGKIAAWACTECQNNFNIIKKFKRKTDTLRHVRTRHFADENKISCEEPNCDRKGDRGFTREDHYKEHLRETHKKPIPKITKGGSQKATQQRR